MNKKHIKIHKLLPFNLLLFTISPANQTQQYWPRISSSVFLSRPQRCRFSLCRTGFPKKNTINRRILADSG